MLPFAKTVKFEIKHDQYNQKDQGKQERKVSVYHSLWFETFQLLFCNFITVIQCFGGLITTPDFLPFSTWEPLHNKFQVRFSVSIGDKESVFIIWQNGQRFAVDRIEIHLIDLRRKEIEIGESQIWDSGSCYQEQAILVAESR